jgi:hypothetical protein
MSKALFFYLMKTFWLKHLHFMQSFPLANLASHVHTLTDDFP